MSPTTLAYSQVSPPQDEDRFVTLIKQADALEISIRRTERKLKDHNTLRADVAFVLVASAFILAVTLAISPYLNLRYAVPQIISLVAAFTVVVLAYLLHVAYLNAMASHELARARRYAVEDGRSALTRAFATLDGARTAEPVDRETRARIDCAIGEADDANARLQKLETQTPRNIDEAVSSRTGPRSSVLAGIVGGFAGAAVGVSLASDGAMVVAGPVGAAIGIAVAVLAWRGPAHWRVERATERTTEALVLYHQELSRPADGVPANLRDNHWERYDRLMSSYSALAERAIGGSYGVPGAPTAGHRSTEGRGSPDTDQSAAR
jgi:hypothetical protein